MNKQRHVKSLRDSLILGEIDPFLIDDLIKKCYDQRSFDEMPSIGFLYLPEEHCNGHNSEALQEYGKNLYACKYKIIKVNHERAEVIFFDGHHKRVWYDHFMLDDWNVEGNVLIKL